MSIQQLFEISRRAFISLNSNMNVVGQNIANAETPGYTRRRAIQRTDALSIAGVTMGSPDPRARGLGVSIDSVDRMRDRLLYRSQLRAESERAAADTRHQVLSVLESLFPAEAPQSLDAQLTAFWNAWNDVANHPADTTVRTALVGKTEQLIATIQSTDRGLQRLQEAQEQEMRTRIAEANDLLKRIAALNERITRAQHAGAPDLTAEDERDRLLNTLSGLLPVETRTDADGQFRLSVHGLTLIEHSQVQELAWDASQSPSLILKGTDMTLELSPDSGRIGGLKHFLEETLPGVRQELDTLVAALVEKVNALHETGYGLDGTTGRPFFDPSGTTASTLTLSAEIREDPGRIAASASADAPGNNAIARAITELQSSPLTELDDRSLTDYAIAITANVGSQVEHAASTLEARQFAVDHLSALEQSISGVSLDEEMTLMVQYQQQFAASAKVLQAAQSMLDTIINL